MFIALSKFLKLNHKNKKSEHENFNLKVILLDSSEISMKININEKVAILFDKICFNLNLDIKDNFGLKYINEEKNLKWLQLSKTFSSQILSFPCTIYFSVKFYPVDPCKINSEFIRYHIFLQVKRDIYEGKVILSHDLAVLLGAYAVQSELGDFDPIDHTPGYISEFNLIPNQTQEFEFYVQERHKTLKGRTSVKSEFQYLDRVKWLEFYGVQLFPVLGEDKKPYFFGLSPLGLLIFKQEIKIGSYFWCRIIKFTFKSKDLYVKIRDRQGNEKSLTFELSSKETCKYLCKLSTEHQAYYKSSEISYMMQDNVSGKLLSFGSRYFQRDKKRKGTQSQIIRRKPSGHASQPETQSAAALNPLLRSDKIKQDDEISIRTSKSSFHHPSTEEYMYSPLSMRSERICRHNKKHNNRNAITACESATSYNSVGDVNASERSSNRFGKKKHRARSRSPINQVPKELAQYFRYVDPTEEGLPDEFVQDIHYTAVQTDAGNHRVRFSPRTKNKIQQSRRLAACKPLSELVYKMPDGEAPPPYHSSPNEDSHFDNHFISANEQLIVIRSDEDSSPVLTNSRDNITSNQPDSNSGNVFLEIENASGLFLGNLQNGVSSEIFQKTYTNLPIAMPIRVQSPPRTQPLKMMTAPIIKTKSLSRVEIAAINNNNSLLEKSINDCQEVCN